MTRTSLFVIILLIILCLSACNGKDSNPKINTVSAATLTEREQAILTNAADQMILGSICYTANVIGMSSLSSDFYADAENHMRELSNYDVVYLLRSKFIN